MTIMSSHDRLRWGHPPRHAPTAVTRTNIDIYGGETTRLINEIAPVASLGGLLRGVVVYNYGIAPAK